MEELVKALGPWPMVQGIVIGLFVAAAGFWAIRKGLQDSRKETGHVPRVVRIEHTDEEKRWQWEAYKQLGHIEKNSFEIAKHSEDAVELLREVAKGINRMADAYWNSRQ